jgi:quinoprotein glucose dehydrogenase
MLKFIRGSARSGVIFILAVILTHAGAAEFVPDAFNAPVVAPASDEAELAIKRFRVPKGFKVELFAAEPLLANPVAFCIDHQGRFYVAETYRLHTGVTDIRGHMNWLDDDLANRSVADRVAMMKRYESNRIASYTRESERLRMLVDTNGDGKADKSTIFSEGYNRIEDGIAAGVLARNGSVYFANIPDLISLKDTDNDGVADVKNVLHTGYGVRVGFLGHDLHGLIMGPDGKLYFSIGDRGASVKQGGRLIDNPETGAVYRCNPDGSELEIVHLGLRNPQELAFDQYGNLWTGDNNSDGGDPARWVYIVEGGDSGWRIGWQFINTPNSRGPWIAERMCYPDSTAAYALPPIANIANGPSGLAYYPGIGLPARYKDHFFLCDFRGSSESGVHSFAVKPKGAGFELIDRTDFLWGVLVTDGDFGFDGCFYISDWVNGWNKPGKGRIYRLYDPAATNHPVVVETKQLFAEGFSQRPTSTLAGLLTHPDMRVRQEAQFALAERGESSIKTFSLLARANDSLVARLHAIWGLGQLARKSSSAAEALLPLLEDRDPEVRAQTAHVLGDARAKQAFPRLAKLLSDSSPRPRFFAAIALGKLGKSQAVAPVLEMLRANDNRDHYLRHAGVMALAGCAKSGQLEKLSTDPSSGVRMAALLALRRSGRPEVAAFLQDSDPAIVLEAARAINDLPVRDALPVLAGLGDPSRLLAALDKQRGRVALPDRKVPPATTLATESVDFASALARRVLNANFRLGFSDNATRLAVMASMTHVPEAVRAEALAALAAWEKPSGRDRVTGLWRPLQPRDPQIAAAALRPKLSELLARSPSSVKIAATKAASQLHISEATAAAFATVRDTKQPSNLRIEAMKSLASARDPNLPEALKIALHDPDETLRAEATRMQAQLQPSDAVAQVRKALESGSVREKQNAFATLGDLTNSPAADEVLLQWMDRLLADQVPSELQVDLTEAISRRNSLPFQERIRRFENSRPPEDDMRAWRECLTGGDAAEGKKIFLERAEVSCVRCHKINGEGGEVGPDLTGIASHKPRDYILESIVYPNKHLAEGYESVVVALRSGTTYAGTVKRETETELEVNSPEDGLLLIKKSDIKAREKGLSAMPEELRQVLTKRDLRDLVEFLATLK